MGVYVKALGVATKAHRAIPYRVCIGQYSCIFVGTVRQLHRFIEQTRPIIAALPN